MGSTFYLHFLERDGFSKHYLALWEALLAWLQEFLEDNVTLVLYEPMEGHEAYLVIHTGREHEEMEFIRRVSEALDETRLAGFMLNKTRVYVLPADIESWRAFPERHTVPDAG